MFPLLRELCALLGPTGREDAVRERLRERWQARLAELRVDAVGKLLARVGGSGLRLLLHAHMDEIPYVVRLVTAEGFVLFDTGQGWRRDGPEPRHMVGVDAVVVGRGGALARGALATPAGDVLTREQLERKWPTWDDLFLDLGVDGRAEVEALGVYVGAGVVAAADTRQVGRRAVGKALDDRVALAVLDFLLDELDPGAVEYELWFAATVQEENGTHGARAVANTAPFDASIALDVGLVGDVRDVGDSAYDSSIGGWPAIVHKDALVFYGAAERRDPQRGPGRRRSDAGRCVRRVRIGWGRLRRRQRPVDAPDGPEALHAHGVWMVDPTDVESLVRVLTAFLPRRGPLHR